MYIINSAKVEKRIFPVLSPSIILRIHTEAPMLGSVRVGRRPFSECSDLLMLENSAVPWPSNELRHQDVDS